MVYICNFHVLNHLILTFICKLHWILVTQYTSRSILMEQAANTQLFVKSDHERLFGKIDKMLHQLQLNAETQELWGNLETAEVRQPASTRSMSQIAKPLN